MAELRPYPFSALIRHMFRELERHDSIFHLPRRKMVLGAPPGSPPLDFSVYFHGHRAETPFGPAAGPHTQMAHNIVLSWLAGGRIIELKTVQIMDELRIPRPCIDMQTVGYNVEWSQELKLEQSVEEYVKASMLIDMLVASGKLDVSPGLALPLFDMSVGYDLKGIQSERVQAFMRGLMDAGPIVERLRAQIPVEFSALRSVDFRTRLSDTLTLSTFHGCPPKEIEQIIDWLLREMGLHCIVKLNPMLNGRDEARALLHDALGYDDIHIPDTAFERDATWEQATAFVERLRGTAAALALGFGIKLTNTLIVENRRSFFPPTEKEMYLSGPPLHVLAMNLVRRFRRQFGASLPISFSAGIDSANFPDAVALGLVPITVCSDLLRPGGYGRAQSYFARLASRMTAAGARDVDEFILRAYGHAEAALDRSGMESTTREACLAALAAGAPLQSAAGKHFRSWIHAAIELNTESYVAAAVQDARYGRAQNAKPPRKLGSHLALFDCISCDKCLPVCPNDANFTFVLPEGELPVVKVTAVDGQWHVAREAPISIEQKHQIGNYADFCNECGNCDVFCPEDGGPYVVKPRFFGTAADWYSMADHDGFYVEDSLVLARFQGRPFEIELGEKVQYRGETFDVSFHADRPETTMSGTAAGPVDLTYYRIAEALYRALRASGQVTYVDSRAQDHGRAP